MKGLVGFLLFQAGWFAAVAAAGAGRPALGLAAMAAILAFHLARSGARGRECALLATAVVLGTGVDSACEQLGLLAYPPEGRLDERLCPLWISGLWALFAATLRGPLAWLAPRPLLAVVFGAIGSGASYLAAERFGAVTVARPLLFPLALVGGAWALVTPLLLALAQERPRPRWQVVALVAGVVALVATLRSPTRAQTHARLLELPKNRPLAQLAGARLDVLSLPVRDAHGVATLEWRWLHVRPLADLPERPPLLLLHGTPSTLFTFSHLIVGGTTTAGVPFRGLAEDFALIVPDLPGHGATTALRGPVTLDALADALDSFLGALAAPPVIAVGHSYGGEVAIRLALRHPSRVARLVLIDSSGLHRPDDEVPDEELPLKRHPLAPFGRSLTSLADTREALRISFVGPVPEDEAAENFLALATAPNWRTMIDLARDEEGYAEAQLATLKLPTLLLWGAGDRNFPPERHGPRFAAAIAGSRLEVVDGSGHYLPIERPDAVAAALREFVPAR